jgi:WD40-like Beta Propeller Repeat
VIERPVRFTLHQTRMVSAAMASSMRPCIAWWCACVRAAFSWMVMATLGCVGCDDGILLGRIVTDAGAFGAPAIVQELAASGYNDFKETLPASMLEIYFCSDRPGCAGPQNVWFAARASTGDAWSAPNCVLEVSSASHESGTAISADGLTLWLSSDRPGGKGGYDIYVSTRRFPGASWSTPTPVAELNTTGDEFPRAPAESGLVMPPSYRSTPNNQYQTFMTSRPDAGAPWTMTVRLDEVDTANIDTDAFLTEDGLSLYFSSDRAHPGDQDLFVAGRPNVQARFGSFTALGELNVTGFQDRDPWLSPDGSEIYLSSDRGGTLKIYRATR